MAFFSTSKGGIVVVVDHPALASCSTTKDERKINQEERLYDVELFSIQVLE